MVRYENPWRPNYEAAAVAGWVVIGVFSWGTADLWGLHEAPFRYLAGFAVLMTVTWMPGAMRQWRRRSRLRGRPLAFLLPPTLQRILRQDPKRLWLGLGFDWEGGHAQLVHDLVRTGPSQVAGSTPVVSKIGSPPNSEAISRRNDSVFPRCPPRWPSVGRWNSADGVGSRVAR
jgi:conjugal transfer pilus assembly protein TraD